MRLTILLTALLLFTSAASTLLSADTNHDGKVDNSDATFIYDYILGTAPIGTTLEQVDVNGDGKADTADVVAVYKYIKECSDIEGGAPDSDDSEFSAPAQRRGAWGNLWSE